MAVATTILVNPPPTSRCRPLPRPLPRRGGRRPVGRTQAPGQDNSRCRLTRPAITPPQAVPWGGALPNPSPDNSRQGHSWLPPYPVSGSAPHHEVPVTRNKPGRTWLIVISTIVLALVAGFGGGTWSARTFGSSQVGTSSIPTMSSPTVSIDQSATPDGSVQQVATAILPSVVSVLASSAGSAGEGSGVILSSDGLILTNNHVISGASAVGPVLRWLHRTCVGDRR
jgi:putative serine protease PepD